MTATPQGYLWTAGAPGRCACQVRGYGLGGKCLAHAEQEKGALKT